MKLDYTNFNTMSFEELCKIPGFGKTTAKRLISKRPLKSDNDLFTINGLGRTTLERLGIEKKKRVTKSYLKRQIESGEFELPGSFEDFNEISFEKLCVIPGIGNKTAKRIVGWRPFKSNDDLFKVKGLGKTTLKRLGIEKVKKQRTKWMKNPSDNDGIEYPHSCFATDVKTNKIDFFWRIPRDRRLYYGDEERSLDIINKIKTRKEQEAIIKNEQELSFG